MGNASSTANPVRRLSRASVSSAGAVDAQLSAPSEPGPEYGRNNANAGLDEFDDEAFDLPSFAPRRVPRRHSAPTSSESTTNFTESDTYTSSLLSRDDDDDGDTLCDSASIMTSFTDTTLSSDPLPAYAAGSTVVSGAVQAAMDVLNGNAKGWRRDVALAQLEWLAADGARRARWVRSEAAARARRVKGRRASLGTTRGKKAREAMRLSVAGEERVVAEDAATARRVGMETRAGEERAAKEEEAKNELARAEPVALPTSWASPEERDEAYKASRAAHRAAEERYHATCAQAATEHSAVRAHAALSHERAFSACKVTYMGARLREPDLQGEVTFTAAAGAQVGVEPKGSAWSGQYKVGRWNR